MPVGVSTLSHDALLIREKLSGAISLIEEVAPLRLKCLQRDVKTILVCLLGHSWAQWWQDERRCAINLSFMESPDATIERLATHARLHRLGFGYSQDLRWRIERLCVLQEIRLAQRMKDAGELIEELHRLEPAAG